MNLLYPQLGSASARKLIPALLRLDPQAILTDKQFSWGSHKDAVYSATGGTRTSDPQISALVETTTKHAKDCGFPCPPSSVQRLRFDYEAAEILRLQMHLSPSEASQSGIWNHLCCVNLPHIVRWRFPDDKEERFLSGRRNMLERLWRRVFIMSDPTKPENPLWMLKELGEDEIVQLMERPQLHGRSTLARDTARLFLATPDDSSYSRRDLFREMQKRLRRLASIIEFDALTDQERERILLDTILQTRASLTVRESTQTGTDG